MKRIISIFNSSNCYIEIEDYKFPALSETVVEFELTSMIFQKVRAHKEFIIGKPGQFAEAIKQKKRELLNAADRKVADEIEKQRRYYEMNHATIFNKYHFPISVCGYTFPPGIEIEIEINTTTTQFAELRSHKGLRVGKINNDVYKEKYFAKPTGKQYNFCYDTYSQHRGDSYVKAIEALSKPIIKHLPAGDTGFCSVPNYEGINLRFFSDLRITEQGKYPVGPKDVFMSHGIGDKDYWMADHIAAYRHALVPGPAWKQRIELGGYDGEIHVVGYTKLDPLFNGEYTRNKHDRPYVVWAPTHGYNGKHKGRSSYPQCMHLIGDISAEYDKSIALHPTSKVTRNEKQDVTMQDLIDADVVIADAGSTLYEAWALGKPVVFPDWICKHDVLAHFEPGNLEYEIYSRQIGYHAKDMKDMNKKIAMALTQGMQQKEIEFMETIFPSELRGKAGAKSAEVLMQIANA